ncbi:ATP-binding protein [Streptomyces sparsogenes]|uniref:ATP-binding protein n=1 Tax=Streptomyces sparsogenes TaxID=67365 RepID=UPI00384D845B
MDEEGAGVAGHRFRASSASLGRIRRFTQQTLARWGRRHCADEVTMVVGELVANAVRHALAPHPDRHGWLGLMNTTKTVVCAVQDPSPDKPLPRTAPLTTLAAEGSSSSANSPTTGGTHSTATPARRSGRLCPPPSPHALPGRERAEVQRHRGSGTHTALPSCPRGPALVDQAAVALAVFRRTI